MPIFTALSKFKSCNDIILVVMWDVMDLNIIAVFFVKQNGLIWLSKIIVENSSLCLLESELLHCHPYSGDHVPFFRKNIGLATISIRTWL